MLPILPGSKNPAVSATNPRMERFKRLVPNPTEHTGITVGGNPLPSHSIMGVKPLSPKPALGMAYGGIVGYYGGSSDPSYQSGSSDVNPQVSDSIDSDMYENLPSSAMPSGWKDPSTMGVVPSVSIGPNPDPESSDSPKTGFNGWMNSQHAGFMGKDWLKAGLTALTGILSGVASAHPYKAPGNPANSIVPSKYGYSNPISFANMGNIGVGTSSGYAEGGPVTPSPGIMPKGPSSPSNTQPGPSGGGQPDQQMLIGVLAALSGKLPKAQAQQAIRAFVQKYGIDALKALVSQLSQTQGASGQQPMPPQTPSPAPPGGIMPPPGGMAGGGSLSGPGDGMSDSIPANGGNVKLSTGEYVVPADAVSMLGNGDNKAGSKMLDQGIARLRRHKYGRAQQPPRTKPGTMVPGIV